MEATAVLQGRAGGVYPVGLDHGRSGVGISKWGFVPFEADYRRFVAYTRLPLPLGVIVYVPALRVDSVISGRSTCDGQRWRVTFFNRHYWHIEHTGFARAQFEVIRSANCAAVASTAQLA